MKIEEFICLKIEEFSKLGKTWRPARPTIWDYLGRHPGANRLFGKAPRGIVTLEAFGLTLLAFGLTLEAIWSQFGDLWAHLGDLWAHFGGHLVSLWRSLGSPWRPLGHNSQKKTKKNKKLQNSSRNA